MGDGLSPLTSVSPPPPPSSSSSSSKTNTPMLYYGLAVVGTAAIMLVMFNLIIIKRCSRRRMQSQTARPNGLVNEAVTAASSRSFENSSSNWNLLSSFKYKKEAEAEEGAGAEAEGGVGGKEQQVGGDYECPVCLSVFEDGEEVRKLPRCKHSFHAICIDMWLYSHFDCPICRTPVETLPCHRFPRDINTPPEDSRDGLLEAGILF